MQQRIDFSPVGFCYLVGACLHSLLQYYQNPKHYSWRQDRIYIVMLMFGHLQKYKAEVKNISSYLERVELFFNANGVADNKRVPVFLCEVGATMYTLLHDLLALEKPQAKDIDDLFKKLRNHYEPKPLVLAERFFFYQRNQKFSELVSEYVAELRKLSEQCELPNF